MDRRMFLKSAAIGVAGPGVSLGQQPRSPNDRVTVCVMGVRGRGGSLLSTFASLPDVDVKYVCDLDENVLGPRVQQTADKTGRKPQGIADYRIALDDKSVDAIVAGTPDHWHALPTIHACQAGKDVYAEKPLGVTFAEGKTLIAAAKKKGLRVGSAPDTFLGGSHQQARAVIDSGKLGTIVGGTAFFACPARIANGSASRVAGFRASAPI